MKEALWQFVGLIAAVHDRLLRINDSFPTVLTDKELHFLVIGILGMGLFFFIQPLFHALIRRGRERVISWFYVLTLIIVLTFSIEIGQHVTHTGTLEFADIVFGVVGFLAFFAVYALTRTIIRLSIELFRRGRKRRSESREEYRKTA